MSTTASGPIRVCFLIDRLRIAGTETQLLMLIDQLDRQRVRPYLALLNEPDEHSASLEPKDCPAIYLSVARLCSLSAARQAWRFARFLRSEKIDILQTYFPDSTYFGFVAAKLARRPQLITTRRNIGHWMTNRDRRFSRYVARRAVAIIANCEACRQAVIEQEGADPSRVHVIPNCIDLSRFTHIPPYQPSCNGRPRKVGMLANLRHVKGTDIFIEAAARVAQQHKNVMFELAGEGDRPWAEGVIRDFGLEGHVKLLGRVDDVPNWLATLDVAVLASRAEGLSNALMEYMAAGRPIVATEVGGNREIIQNGENGVLVESGNPHDLAEGITKLLVPEQACTLAKRARECATSRARAGAIERHGRLWLRTLQQNSTEPEAMR